MLEEKEPVKSEKENYRRIFNFSWPDVAVHGHIQKHLCVQTSHRYHGADGAEICGAYCRGGRDRCCGR